MAGPGHLDPAMRRSYLRTQQRLADQAGRARESFPELAIDAPARPGSPSPSAPATTEDAHDDDVSPDALEQEVEQTSETLDMLERIASLQQQQVEHQESQLLSETRGLFFAFLVSVAVIVAGVAPLVEAEPHDRLLIVLWTLAASPRPAWCTSSSEACRARSDRRRSTGPVHVPRRERRR